MSWQVRRSSELLGYGVNVLTTVCTALLVPFTTLWPTFLAVCTLPFATFFAVLTGPASIVPTETAHARIIEKNAFIVLNNSFLTACMRLVEGRRVAAVAVSLRRKANIKDDAERTLDQIRSLNISRTRALCSRI
jgi:hypothetical protein